MCWLKAAAALRLQQLGGWGKGWRQLWALTNMDRSAATSRVLQGPRHFMMSAA